jgi:Uncharacterized enzyme of phosphonate metabolism
LAVSWFKEKQAPQVIISHLGEVTITRCSLNVDKKIQGQGYVQGRTKYNSKIAAVCVALMQNEKKKIIKRNIIDKLIKYKNNKRNEMLYKTEDTKVDFFTLVRGEDK